MARPRLTPEAMLERRTLALRTYQETKSFRTAAAVAHCSIPAVRTWFALSRDGTTPPDVIWHKSGRIGRTPKQRRGGRPGWTACRPGDVARRTRAR
jgi:hypothetical protein